MAACYFRTSLRIKVLPFLKTNVLIAEKWLCGISCKGLSSPTELFCKSSGKLARPVSCALQNINRSCLKDYDILFPSMVLDQFLSTAMKSCSHINR